jgi:hypothetical protein
MNSLLKILGVLALCFISTFLQLYVVSKLWGYIVVPIGAPEIGLKMALGIFMLVNIMTYEYKEEPEVSMEVGCKRVLVSIAASLIAWSLGYLIFA